jgi:hypothetical protein
LKNHPVVVITTPATHIIHTVGADRTFAKERVEIVIGISPAKGTKLTNQAHRRQV